MEPLQGAHDGLQGELQDDGKDEGYRDLARKVEGIGQEQSEDARQENRLVVARRLQLHGSGMLGGGIGRCSGGGLRRADGAELDIVAPMGGDGWSHAPPVLSGAFLSGSGPCPRRIMALCTDRSSSAVLPGG